MLLFTFAFVLFEKSAAKIINFIEMAKDNLVITISFLIFAPKLQIIEKQT